MGLEGKKRLGLLLLCLAPAAQAAVVGVDLGWALPARNPSRVQGILAAPTVSLRAGWDVRPLLEAGLSLNQATFFNADQYLSARSLAVDLRLRPFPHTRMQPWLGAGFGWNFMSGHFSNWRGRWAVPTQLGLDLLLNARWKVRLAYGFHTFSPFEDAFQFHEGRLGLERHFE